MVIEIVFFVVCTDCCRRSLSFGCVIYFLFFVEKLFDILEYIGFFILFCDFYFLWKYDECIIYKFLVFLVNVGYSY